MPNITMKLRITVILYDKTPVLLSCILSLMCKYLKDTHTHKKDSDIDSTVYPVVDVWGSVGREDQCLAVCARKLTGVDGFALEIIASQNRR